MIWLEKGPLFIAFSSHADNCITHCVVLERVEALGRREAAACMFHVTSALVVCLDFQLHSACYSEDRLFKIWRNVLILLTWGGCGQRHLPQASPRDAEHDRPSFAGHHEAAAKWLHPHPSGNVTQLLCLPVLWHNNQTSLPPLPTARIILLSLLEAGGPVLVTCPFLVGSCPVILGEC